MQFLVDQRVVIVATQALSEHFESKMDHSPSSAMHVKWSNSVHLIYSFQEALSRDGHKLFSVKLTKSITEPPCPGVVEQVVSDACKEPCYESASSVQLSHYIGGSNRQDRLKCCIVFGGDGCGDDCGWTVEPCLEKAIQMAYRRACRGWPAQGKICSGQTVRIMGIMGLIAESKLNGELGIAVKFNGENNLWMVQLLRTGEGKQLNHNNLEGMEGDCGRVFCYWGDEVWTRASLLSGIESGFLRICKGNVGDLAGPPDECWKNTIGRSTEQRLLQQVEIVGKTPSGRRPSASAVTVASSTAGVARRVTQGRGRSPPTRERAHEELEQDLQPAAKRHHPAVKDTWRIA
jgi:hypothetical protein